MKRVTLEDVSAHLNLSKFSVSRALSGKGGVSDRTRAMVFEAARSLGYDHPAVDRRVPDASRRLALVIPRIDADHSQFWTQTLAGAEAEAERMGYDLSVNMIGEDRTRPRPLPKVKGLILAGRRSRGLTDPFLTLGLPVTVIGHPYPLEAVDSVRASSWTSGYLMGLHFAELGHRAVAYVTDVPEDKARQERLRGFRDAMSRHDDASVSVHHLDLETDAVAALAQICTSDVMPTAIFGATDLVAITIAWGLTELGVRVPQQVSIAGCNNLEVAKRIGLKLTTVNYPMREVGAAAIHMLDWRIEQAGSNEPTRQLLLQPELVRRDSTDTPGLTHETAEAISRATAGRAAAARSSGRKRPRLQRFAEIGRGR